MSLSTLNCFSWNELSKIFSNHPKFDYSKLVFQNKILIRVQNSINSIVQPIKSSLPNLVFFMAESIETSDIANKSLYSNILVLLLSLIFSDEMIFFKSFYSKQKTYLNFFASLIRGRTKKF